MSKNGWLKKQILDTIKEYFNLLNSQEQGIKENKTEIYRKLSEKHPGRSPKAFELKFQNISAILYEENLPYCDGLKPRFNYQNLLKVLVLNHLKHSPVTPQEPHQILFGKLRALKKKEHLRVTAAGSGRFGLTIEENLGIPANSDKGADFMGIELKTKKDKSLQTLFSRVPDRYIGCADKKELVVKYGYFDSSRNRQALYTSFSNKPDSMGFNLWVKGNIIAIRKKNINLMEYDAESLESALLSKHSQTAFITLSNTKKKDIEYCTIESVRYCKWPSIIKFLKLVEDDKVFLDLTLSQEGERIKDHGFLWRIRTEAINELYLYSAMEPLDRN
ncbi:MAG: hypothetical protein K9N35_11710 [Candidatus Marinimicrobia bacterium]|nr:hypothetical protein [Candidatus Neomarinimicrobiota bacterium]